MKGFTLIETLVAITILTLAISGPLFTANRAIVAAENARDQLTALYLAQEGIEYVRMMRDNSYLAAYRDRQSGDISSVAWDTFINGLSDLSSVRQCLAPKFCTLDPMQGSISPLASCPGNSQREQCRTLSLTGCERRNGTLSCIGSNAYTQQNPSGSAETSYRRTIQIQAESVSETEAKITSTVSWDFNGTPYAITITDHLTPWQ
ncbi:hypothetical protein A3J11_00300 [Candidatus Kaiserbacteria bacterium RIFCSPLOWO2_02_FULL_55_12]|uniref:Type II secretion system protein J n=2 Tax=Candidatus Kaiseribacteriota TaxID=1752734 RepID=A0A1F6F0F9_9BACT|nr:MAG: hypothetical protein A3C94_00365 [Candidatus Kaiserbacteria bacterium RIFCSPHIGHO2_02_FULL_55_17]OGG79340.1 MAG: hypothetical protein A3J11_00300 [Candidatus Kaiserbacteria bacterium RIFCSPLOWO2_02_FULL_55_12]